MFAIQFYDRGRNHYLKAEAYDTAVIVAEALERQGLHNVEVWKGRELMRRGNVTD